MIIGILSDTHDRIEQMQAALDFFAINNVGLVVHCGDWKSLSTVQACAEYANQLHLPVSGVIGNNDLDVAGFLSYTAQAPGDFALQEGVLEMKINGKRITAYHGHHKPTLRHLIFDESIDILLLGHTHKPLITNDNDHLIVNPGSTAFAIPRSRTWRPCVALVDTVSLTAEIHYLL